MLLSYTQAGLKLGVISLLYARHRIDSFTMINKKGKQYSNLRGLEEGLEVPEERHVSRREQNTRNEEEERMKL